jgi:predicted aminopeptidase
MTRGDAPGAPGGGRPRWRDWRWWRRVAGRGVLAVLALLASLGTLTPMGRYVARAAWAEGKILARRRPIPLLLRDSTVPAGERARLHLVTDARDWARRTLALKAGASFTTYARTDRDTLVLVLSAARRDTLAPYTWWFPVVGRFPYKGFFNPAEAGRAAAALGAQGWATYLRPASAFSTLGWFNDPLLSTTLRLDSLSLATTVFHELTHNTLFLKGNVAFNESFASFVGARGAAEFFRARGSPRAARGVERRWADDKLMGAFWGAVAHAIDSAFAAHPGDSATRVAAGDTVYAGMRRVLREDLVPRMPSFPPGAFDRLQLDNAALLARRVYASDLWLFDEVHRRSGGNLRRTIALVRTQVEGKDDPFAALRGWLSSPASPPPPPAGVPPTGQAGAALPNK